MVRLTAASALLALSLAPYSSANPLKSLQDAGSNLVKMGLKRVLGFNETQIERVMKSEAHKLDGHPYAVDLTDENWETVLATGSEDPFAKPLGEDAVWVITVYGPDPISKVFVEGTNAVATYNSSAAGGTLPSNLHFARLSYATQTILPTKWWLWRVPVIVVATDKMQTLRFIRPGQVRPFAGDISDLLQHRQMWERAPAWKGVAAPGGKLEQMLHQIAVYWARFHQVSSKVPNFVLLAFSGFLMNFVLSYFHKDDKQLQKEYDARKAKERAGAAASAAAPAASTTATKAKKAPGKRK
ncbi:hypothetical protein JCM11641_001363 [Rhodosporidiobolus odoratus]